MLGFQAYAAAFYMGLNSDLHAHAAKVVLQKHLHGALGALTVHEASTSPLSVLLNLPQTLGQFLLRCCNQRGSFFKWMHKVCSEK